MRRVLVYKLEWQEEAKRHMKVEDFQGYFHAWGCGYVEGETGFGNFSTAIVERDDGSVENVYVEMIKFLS